MFLVVIEMGIYTILFDLGYAALCPVKVSHDVGNQVRGSMFNGCIFRMIFIARKLFYLTVLQNN